MTKQSICGLYTATITPFDANAGINKKAVLQLVEDQIAAGAQGIVAIGGTGEGGALTLEERVEVVGLSVEAAKSRVPVLAGVTSPLLPDALNAGKECLKAGADGLMVITPYGTAPSQAGIRDYYKAYADGVGQSVMLYDIPYLTSVTTQPETVQQIVADGSIFAMKASNPDQAAFARLISLVGNDIAVMSGDEHMFAVQIAMGAVGGVLASNNILPRTWLEIFEAAKSGNLVLAQQQIARLYDFLVSVYSQPNPGPMKAAQALAGFHVGNVRVPNRTADPALVNELKQHLEALLPYERQLATKQ